MSTTTKQRDISLAEIDPDEIGPGEELYLLSQATNEDGTINVRIYDWGKAVVENEEIAEVRFMTPSGDIEHEHMAWPSRDDPQYKFVRICNQYGTGVVDPDAIETQLVPAVEEDGDWELRVERERSLKELLKPDLSFFTRERIAHFLGGVGAFLAGICMIGSVITFLLCLASVLAWGFFGAFFVSFIIGVLLLAIFEDDLDNQKA